MNSEQKQKSKSSAVGFILLALGIVLLLNQFGWIGPHVFLYFLVLGFFGGYRWAGAAHRYSNIGLLIPGCILLAMALFNDIERLFDGLWLGPAWFFLLLAAAFLAVYFVHTRVSGTDKGSRQWPLYPAGGLLGFGIFITLVSHLEVLKTSPIVNYVIPLVLIGAGVLIILRKPQTPGK